MPIGNEVHERAGEFQKSVWEPKGDHPEDQIEASSGNEIHRPIESSSDHLASAFSIRDLTRSLTRSTGVRTWESAINLCCDENRSQEMIFSRLAMKFMRE